MSLHQVIVPLFTHFIPILFFTYMTIDVWLRNPNKVEHRLVGITAACFMLLFLEEYVRHQLPLAYSPRLSAIWFSSVGITIPGLGFHLFVKLAQLDRKMPKYLYPYIFYVPLLLVIVNIVTNDAMMSAVAFSEQGIWKLPVYNQAYYITMTASIVNNFLYLIPLYIGRNKADLRELREIYKHLILGVLISAAWFIVFGLINFGSSLPPYPYLYGGIVWCFFLRATMRKYDFLNFSDKRYEKLFNLNPSAILLVDLQGRVKEANPSAKLLFGSMELDYQNFYALLDEDIRNLIDRRKAIQNAEMTIRNRNKQLDVLIDGDYVHVEHQPYVILIVRDISMQKKNQSEVTFLAYHDPLTRLPNRRFFYLQLEEAIRKARERGERLAAVLIDLDRFKDINDKYGHQAGDEVLQRAAEVIRETVGHHGVAARLGGDEFVFYMYPVPSEQAVEDMIARLQLAFTQTGLNRDGLSIPIEMSIGASFYPEDGWDGDELLNNADKAMYHDKRKRRNKTRLYEQS